MILYPSAAVSDLLTHLDANVMQLLIVSALEIKPDKTAVPEDATDFGDVAVKVEHAPGEVCPRCRMTRTDIGVDPQLPTLCGRCAKIVAANYPEAVQNGFDE